jgi:hypothetical protein
MSREEMRVRRLGQVLGGNGLEVQMARVFFRDVFIASQLRN